jgi:hypothetical protein
MKGGAENRKKTIALGVLGAIAVCGLLYNVAGLFGGSSTPPPAIAPVTNAPTPVRPAAGGATGTARAGAASTGSAPGGSGAIPGVAAEKVASNSQSLDPTLDQAAMLRTEGLVYSGSGRNIFSATLFVPPPAIPKNVPPPRPNPVAHPVQPVNMGPPPPPPIPLKFFGTAQRAGKPRQVFLLSGDDVYLAGQGDIVAKRYKIMLITTFTVAVTDLTNNNTQTLPLQQQ